MEWLLTADRVIRKGEAVLWLTQLRLWVLPHLFYVLDLEVRGHALPGSEATLGSPYWLHGFVFLLEDQERSVMSLGHTKESV